MSDMLIYVGAAFAAETAAASDSEWANPVLWVSIACGIGGLALLLMDGINRIIAAQGGVVREALQNETKAVDSIASSTTLTDEEKAAAEAKARAAAEQAIAAYKDMLLKFPQLIIGATLLVVPLFVIGGVTFGIPS